MTDDPKKAVLVRQAHGGALLTGGMIGNKGGGKTPSAVRAAFRESGYNRLHILEGIADNDKVTPRDRINAISVMLDVGLKGNISVDDIRHAVTATLEVIQDYATPEMAEELARRIRPIWRMG